MSPPNKYQKPEEISEGSYVKFFKNGEHITTIRELKQQFYCFAVSLFNYGQVEVLERSDTSF